MGPSSFFPPPRLIYVRSSSREMQLLRFPLFFFFFPLPFPVSWIRSPGGFSPTKRGPVSFFPFVTVINDCPLFQCFFLERHAPPSSSSFKSQNVEPLQFPSFLTWRVPAGFPPDIPTRTVPPPPPPFLNPEVLFGISGMAKLLRLLFLAEIERTCPPSTFPFRPFRRKALPPQKRFSSSPLLIMWSSDFSQAALPRRA